MCNCQRMLSKSILSSKYVIVKVRYHQSVLSSKYDIFKVCYRQSMLSFNVRTIAYFDYLLKISVQLLLKCIGRVKFILLKLRNFLCS